MKASRGFSLIEVMTAVSLFSIALIATFTAWTTATRLIEHQRHAGFALHAGESTMEELLLLSTTDSALPSGQQCFDRDGGRVSCSATTKIYTAAWETTSHPTLAGVLLV